MTNSLAEVFSCVITCWLNSILLVTLGAKAPRVTNRIEFNPHVITHSTTSAKPYCHDSVATSHDRKEEARSVLNPRGYTPRSVLRNRIN